MRYQLVIFDFDGTLADSFPWFSRVLNDVADRYRFKRIEAHEGETLRGMNGRELMRHLGIPAWKMPFIANHMRKRASKDIGEIRLFEGVGPMLSRIMASGAVLAVVSSNSEANVRAVLGGANATLIQYYECGASLFGKQARFRKVLRRSGVSARDSICIGDEIRDCEAARNEGIAFGAATWGYTTPAALAALDPDVAFASMSDIAERLAA